jgi:cell division septation protein DedD
LSLPLIEETRILSDTFGAEGRLQIVFVGQPELHAKLKLPEMRQVDQRICGYHRLAPMSRESVSGYIEHRLQVAGGSRDRVLFPPEIVDGLHRRSGGVPRLINRVCDRALQLAYERQAESVDQEILETALIQVGAATLSPTWDSIIYAEPRTPPPARTPTPAPAADAVEPTPPIDDQDFKSQVDQWAARDLAPSPLPLTKSDVEFAEEAHVATAPERRPAPRTPRTAPRRQAPARTTVTDWPRDLRSETYMHRLWRIWATRAAIALAAFVVLNVIIVGASLLPATLTTPTLPALPAAPAIAVRGLLLPEAPPAEALASVPAEVSLANSGEYLVAVGLFANRDRADRVVDELAQAGLPAMQRGVQLRRQRLEQIVLGPFFTRPEAVAALLRLQLLGGYGDATVIDSTRAHSSQ